MSGIRLKTDKEIQILREGGKRLAEVLCSVASVVKPGVSELELDELAEKLILKNGDTPAFKNYKPDGAKIAFPATLCISVNDAIVHGIPTKNVLEEGDIVGLDLGIKHGGLYTDMAVTVPVGKIIDRHQKLIDITKKALEIGIQSANPGFYTGDIGYAIESFIKKQGSYGIVRELAGHGVGFKVHEPPYVPNYGKAGKGEKLVPGLVIAIEPMVNEGSDEIVLAEDNFTYKTRDKSHSAHFEKTIVIKDDGYEILTP